MCGISGVVSFDGPPVDAQALKKMADRIAHRGPDAEGFWVASHRRVGFAHRRLSILDLSDAGRQPMHDSSGRYTITFNGEIYNYIELKTELEKKGYAFVSTSDTEVLLALYADRGEAALRELDGMFAFAIWDEKEQTLFCARDRLGEKPFYYHLDGGGRFCFGSEMSALFAAGVPRRVRDDRLFAFLAYEAVEDRRDPSSTFFKGIVQLEPAHSLTLRAGKKPEIRRYWQIPGRGSAVPTMDQASQRFRELLETSIRRRLRSDVPVGTCLSGGLDSSSIVMLLDRMRKSSSGSTSSFSQKTFSARMRDPRYDEGQFMQAVLDRASVEPHTVWMEPEEAIAQIDQVFAHQEEPFTTTSVLAQWSVMRLAKEQHVPVLIDGQGADEMLAGYLGFFSVFFKELYRAHDPRLGAELAGYAETQGVRFQAGPRFKLEARFPGLLTGLGALARRFLNRGYFEDLDPARVRSHRSARPPFERSDTLDRALQRATFEGGLTHLLKLCDRNSMAFSREVRLPFLNHELVEFVFSLPPEHKLHLGWTKYVQRKALEDVLPPAIAWRKDKKGFSTPQKEWLGSPVLQARFAAAEKVLREEGWVSAPSSAKRWNYLQAALLLREGRV